MLTSEFSALGIATSCHFGPMTGVPLATNPGEVSALGTESINFLDPSVSFSWQHFFDISAALGAKSALMTSKHVDGMPMWVSATTPGRSISDTTWYAANGHRDLFGEFCTQSRARLGSVGVYFAVGDSYLFEARSHLFDAGYVNQITAQLTEILSNYGVIDYIFLDAWGDTWGVGSAPDFTDIDESVFRDVVQGIQPDCLIINNDHSDSHGDIRLYESPTSDGEPKSGTSMPVALHRPIQRTNKWFSHTDSTTEATEPAATSAILAQKRMVLRNYTIIHNFSPGPDGKIRSDICDVTNKMQSLRVPAVWNGLQNAWNMNAASGQPELDQAYFAETNVQTTLSVVGTPGTTTGMFGSARVVSSGNNFICSTSGASTSILSPGNRSCTFFGWVTHTTFGSFPAVFGKDNNAGGLCEYLLFVDTSVNKPTWRCSHDGATLNDQIAAVAVSLNTPYFFMVGHNAATDKIFIQINGGTYTEKAHNAAGLAASVGKFTVGSREPNSIPMTGNVDELWLIMDRALTSADGLALYNSGSGFAQLGATPTGVFQNSRNLLMMQ